MSPKGLTNDGFRTRTLRPRTESMRESSWVLELCLLFFEVGGRDGRGKDERKLVKRTDYMNYTASAYLIDRRGKVSLSRDGENLCWLAILIRSI